LCYYTTDFNLQIIEQRDAELEDLEEQAEKVKCQLKDTTKVYNSKMNNRD